MNRRKTLIIIGLIVAAVLLILFIAVGIPFIQSTFATPIPGLPTTDAASAPLSLKDRLTQTASAKQTTAAGSSAATATPASP